MQKSVVVSLICVAITGVFAVNNTQSSGWNVSLSTPEKIHQVCAKPHMRRHRRSYFPTKNPLICPPCEQIHCFKYSKRRLYCKGGWTLDVCGCCRVCAKLEGEPCGGEHNYLGKCDENLFCEPQPPTVLTVFINGANRIYKHQRGICKKEFKIAKLVLETCKTKCTPEYCVKNPRAICSASENAEKSQQCQGTCQHTSCRACRFIESKENCPKCAKNDFKCIRDFGRCVRKNSCKPKTYPCGKNFVRSGQGRLFLCQVPDCN